MLVSLSQVVLDAVPWLSGEQFDDAVASLTQLQVTSASFREASSVIRQHAKNANSILFQRNLVVLVLGKVKPSSPTPIQGVVNFLQQT